jgi:hypothetical protein
VLKTITKKLALALGMNKLTESLLCSSPRKASSRYLQDLQGDISQYYNRNQERRSSLTSNQLYNL